MIYSLVEHIITLPDLLLARSFICRVSVTDWFWINRYVFLHSIIINNDNFLLSRHKIIIIIVHVVYFSIYYWLCETNFVWLFHSLLFKLYTHHNLRNISCNNSKVNSNISFDLLFISWRENEINFFTKGKLICSMKRLLHIHISQQMFSTHKNIKSKDFHYRILIFCLKYKYF